jgi:hypothetical protein
MRSFRYPEKQRIQDVFLLQSKQDQRLQKQYASVDKIANDLIQNTRLPKQISSVEETQKKKSARKRDIAPEGKEERRRVLLSFFL